MAESRVVTREIDKPRRWDLPFSRDLPNPDEQRDMTAQDVDRFFGVHRVSSRYGRLAGHSRPRSRSMAKTRHCLRPPTLA